MRSKGFRLFVAVFCGLILVGGIVFSVVTGDEQTLLPTVLLGGLYVLYLVRLVNTLKKEEQQTSKQRSPLSRR